MLNSGDVPGMFAQDEKDRVASDIRDWAHEHGYATSKEACYTAFIDRVRENLHIVLTMSPVGESFRNRCRQFPSLINCCTIDWYTQWPEEALLSVSSQVCPLTYTAFQHCIVDLLVPQQLRATRCTGAGGTALWCAAVVIDVAVPLRSLPER